RHPDDLVGELLRCIDRRIRGDHHRRKADDGAPADLATAGAGASDPAIISPFAGVVHVGLALFEQPAVAGERVDALRAGNAEVELLLDAPVAIRPLDLESLLLEQALVIRDQFRQAPDTPRALHNEFLHDLAP